MPTINPNSFTNLDIFAYKDSIKAYLQSQAEFADINFEGSAVSILLDILAYNTQYNAFQFNMVANEMFLDSATRRSSVVSLASALGYVPRSRKSASALLYLEFTPQVGQTQIVLPAGTKFTSKIDNDTYIFTTRQERVSTVDTDGKIRFDSLEVFEGIPLTHRFVVREDDVIYTIPNAGIDVDRIYVNVRSSATSSDLQIYARAEEILGVNSASKVFFVEEVSDEKFAIRFGDDVIGKKLGNGNVVEITYSISSARDANGATLFELGSSVAGTPTLNLLQTLSPATGGEEIESLESIRRFAPENYSTQGRAVTAVDYARIVRREIPEAESISVWGGEQNFPPQYGFVFVAIKPYDGAFFTVAKKNQLEQSVLRKYGILTVIPKVVDPDYVYIGVKSSVKYNSSVTSLGIEDIKSKVVETILKFSDDELEMFDSYFRFSKFVSTIDNADASILSNETEITINKKLQLKDFSGYTVSFNNAILPGSITSGLFTFFGNTDCKFVDSGVGTLSVVRGTTTIVSNFATVNYATGVVSIPSCSIETPSFLLKMTGSPTTQDISLERLFIGQILPEDISVSVESIIKGSVK